MNLWVGFLILKINYEYLWALFCNVLETLATQNVTFMLFSIILLKDILGVYHRID